MSSPSPALVDTLFREAVTAIDAGDVAALEQIISRHPELPSLRLEEPGVWLREKIGRAANGFFARPYLLWFVAEDPVRNGTLPANIAQVAQTIVEAARQNGVENLQEQLDYAITLVCWSRIARDGGVQIALLDVLLDAGAVPGGNANNALVNGNIAAAEHLVARGGVLTVEAALHLGRWEDAERILSAASEKEKQFAFILAALNGQTEAVRRIMAHGVELDAPSANLYSHATALHHAVCSGSIETVRLLVEAGADVHAVDTAWQGTPFGWAQYYQEEHATDEKAGQYAGIAEYLRKAGGMQA